MQLEISLAPIGIDRFQEETRIRFHDEKSAPLPGRESHEICSGRRHQTSGLHERTSAAGSRILAKTKSARVELVPFPVEIFRDCFILGIWVESKETTALQTFEAAPPFENRKGW